jgi:hypothetical protein
MIRSTAVALAILAAIDSWKFGGVYTHVVKQMVHSVLNHVF